MRAEANDEGEASDEAHALRRGFRLARRPVAGLQAFAWGQERAVPEPTYGRSL